MKKITLILLSMVVSSLCLSAQAPQWVELYLQGKMAEISGTDSYLGVGSSSENQDDADQNARIDFARNVETRVDSSMEEVYLEEGGESESSLSMSLEIKTEMSLKGISITQRYFDEAENTYYSMIKVGRMDYLEILEKNIQEEIALRDAELERQRQELEQQRIAQEQERQQHEQERERLRLEEERRELRRSRYATYWERQPYPALISFENAEVYPGRHHFTSSFSLSDQFEIRKFGYALTIGELFQLGNNYLINPGLEENQLRYIDLDAKMALLDNVGEFFQLSVAFGAKGYILNPSDELEREQNGTLYGVVDVALPQVYYTDFSLYGGLDKIALGAAIYPIFPWFKDYIGVIGEVVYDFREDLQYGKTDSAFRFQTGLQFRPGDAACTRITWEDNFQTFVLAMDVNIGRDRNRR